MNVTTKRCDWCGREVSDTYHEPTTGNELCQPHWDEARAMVLGLRATIMNRIAAKVS